MARNFTEAKNLNAHTQNDGSTEGSERITQPQGETTGTETREEQQGQKLEEAIRQARIARISGCKITGKIAEFMALKALGRLQNEGKI